MPQPVNSGTNPQPVNSGTARTTLNPAVPEQTMKNAAIDADPRASKPAAPGNTRLAAASPSRGDTTTAPITNLVTPQPSAPTIIQTTIQTTVQTPIQDISGGDVGLGTKSNVSTQNSADVAVTGEINAPPPPPKQESTEAAMPADIQSMRKTSSAKSSDSPTPPAIAIATPTPPLPLPPVALRSTTPNSPSGSPPPQLAPAPPQESAVTLSAAPALEVRIRATEEPKENSAPPQAAVEPGAATVTQTPVQTETVQPIPVSPRTVSGQTQSAAQPLAQPQEQPPSNPVAAGPPIPSGSQPQTAPVTAPAAAPVVAPAAAPAATRTERPASQAAQIYEAAEPASQARTQTQPLRSVSLEFTPDGASDVRLRLSERAGDVHIELHSTDPALTGRLSEGVHDLATSLANAGYDAQAWTPGQDRQGGQRQPQEDRQEQHNQSADPDAEDFDTAMQQTPKEYL